MKGDAAGFLDACARNLQPQWESLTGEWFSNLALSVVVISTLGGARSSILQSMESVQQNRFDLLFSLFVPGVPLGRLTGALSLPIETTGRFDGTLGTILYVIVVMVVISQAREESVLPKIIRLPTKPLYLIGLVATYDALSDVLRSAAPGYTRGVAWLGQVYCGTADTYHGTGGGWPL